MNKISIIVPCYNEDAALPIYYKEMCKIMAQMKEEEFELIFVDDGSTDHTLAEMKILHEKDERCQYFSFSRNFGKEAAMYAGLSYADGRLCGHYGCGSAGSAESSARRCTDFTDRRL